jgi:hypothetical protein
MTAMVWQFIKAVFRHWWVWMSCTVFTLQGIVLAAFNLGNIWSVRSFFVLTVVCLMVSFYKAWAESEKKLTIFAGQHKEQIDKLNSEIGRLTASADIRGSLLEVYRPVAEINKFDAPVIIKAEIFNESAVVSPTVKEFVCQIDCLGGTLTARTSDSQPIKGFVSHNQRDGSTNRSPLPSVLLDNFLGLAKHNHREGWLKFVFPGLVPYLEDGSELRLFVVDGSGKDHLIGSAVYPWPSRVGVVLIDREG